MASVRGGFFYPKLVSEYNWNTLLSQTLLGLLALRDDDTQPPLSRHTAPPPPAHLAWWWQQLPSRRCRVVRLTEWFGVSACRTMSDVKSDTDLNVSAADRHHGTKLEA
jgi:hypothetical protein